MLDILRAKAAQLIDTYGRPQQLKIEDLTEKELHEMINYIRTEFHDYLALDLASPAMEWTTYKQEWEDQKLTFGTMEDSEILKLILNNGIAFTNQHGNARYVWIRDHFSIKIITDIIHF